MVVLLDVCARPVLRQTEREIRKSASGTSPDDAGRAQAGQCGVAARPAELLVGRDELVERLSAALGGSDGRHRLTLVAGEAGIGKSSLVGAVVAATALDGAAVGWGTCVAGRSVPGYWPWTQALAELVRAIGVGRARAVAGEDAGQLATLIPDFGAAAVTEMTDRDRLLVWDAIGRFLDALGAGQRIVIVLDDLQWADESSLALLDFLVASRPHGTARVLGAYRGDEVTADLQPHVARLVSHATHLIVPPLDRDAVAEIVRRVAGPAVGTDAIERIARRAGGHPLFTRELALLAAAGGAHDEIPLAVRSAIARRLEQLDATDRRVLDLAAVLGTPVRRDVLAAIVGLPADEMAQVLHESVGAGVLAAGKPPRFAHDLYREAILDGMAPTARTQLHHAIADELERRAERDVDITPAQIAFHTAAAIAVDGPERAARWALAAADHDRASVAFAEAAGHLRRWRAAVADAGVDVDDRLLLDVLLAEADALGRVGESVAARGLLRLARDTAARCGSSAHLARVALGTARLGGRFATRRDEVVAELETARQAVAAVDVVLEAQVTAALARELQHSVPDDRPRAGPLSERALELGRATGDAPTLLECLFARHDVLWTPGAAAQRAPVAREIVEEARRCGDEERLADGLLLVANALLEQGSAAFLADLRECLAILDRLGQPRHRYVAQTRTAALALLRGELDTAEGLIDAAAALGGRIREPDTGNVAMSQRLELVRARGEPDELQAFADQAVAHWSGAAVHAHAVAAGFNARAGQLDAARQHVATVEDLGGWQIDRSYLWSVFVRELAVAAIALGDDALCTALFDDLLPISTSCGVNGALVAFAGSHAHTAGLLAAALQRGDATELLEHARETYRRLGAVGWLAELDTRIAAAPRSVMRRHNGMWEIQYRGGRATVRDLKGLADIALLLSRPGQDVHVLELMGAPAFGTAGDELVDRRALDAYRRRLTELEDDHDEASSHHDDERLVRIDVERERILGELRRVTGPAGRARSFANRPAERARKAVAARVRDAIRKLRSDIPELADHLDAALVTGTYCRYRPEPGTAWHIEADRGTARR
jgi:hypothetical protein